ncbi:MAG: trypsin-like peptidase domain-containing protein [Oscillatoriaceae bacterium SKW80]|nr:trypsin-like peptidase domain-containing protein [Oscillatoriaceae bacterium SKYG93]MCX8120355.1 trypsin-like peptidase domain-containing protein [Oscillatoriaceae bacterium SKW80]MDW8453281.1 HhoA/HhoB/HtrA family serine endopeptidase [Oscillatoriaceae cyanobacterium SKYGB_i_bin93]HIK27277.1 trypsin-like peptidase domain-containing protein [Oscillatoriaceae cyanobacterium M7585_C2015_266]
MSDSEKNLNPWRHLGSHALTVVLSVALTVTALHAFPNLLLPKLSSLSQITTAQPAVASIPKPQSDSRSFVAAAVNRVGPAVVRIDTERTIVDNTPDPFFDDPFFRGFFGEDLFPRMPKEYHQRGQGSGFIIDSNGIILTNAHVVSGADTVTVTLRDGRRFKGEVRGIDELSDLAVVKIDGQNLPIAPLGNSSDLKVGDWAIAVGNPLGLDNTVTLGIISTLNRSSAQVGIPDKRLDFIQTDAAINPGNSGGPLVNERGEVIGINTAIRAEAQGIGFAIPIDKAKSIKDKLARGEKIPHPYIGIRMTTLTPELAKESNSDPNSPFTIPEVNGVLTLQVIPNSPAAAAGLRRGDVILEIDGQPVTSAEKLQSIVEMSRIGQPLKFKVQRGERIEIISVRPGELQDAPRS